MLPHPLFNARVLDCRRVDNIAMDWGIGLYCIKIRMCILRATPAFKAYVFKLHRVDGIACDKPG